MFLEYAENLGSLGIKFPEKIGSVMHHLHMCQYVARPRPECKNQLIVGAGLERVR